MYSSPAWDYGAGNEYDVVVGSTQHVEDISVDKVTDSGKKWVKDLKLDDSGDEDINNSLKSYQRITQIKAYEVTYNSDPLKHYLFRLDITDNFG